MLIIYILKGQDFIPLSFYSKKNISTRSVFSIICTSLTYFLYSGLEWSIPYNCTNTELIITIGQLASKAFDCSTLTPEQPVGQLSEIETGRKVSFYEMSNQTWMAYDKPFSSLGVPELRDIVLSQKWTKITILEAQAAQVSLIRPGLYGLSIGIESKLSNLPVGCAAQGNYKINFYFHF